jgi:hypothetical protein
MNQYELGTEPSGPDRNTRSVQNSTDVHVTTTCKTPTRSSCPVCPTQGRIESGVLSVTEAVFPS